jgi:HK97 family phage portal protein
MAFLPEAFARLVTGRGRAPVALNEKGSRTGALVAFEQLGEPVWSPRDYGSFAREGFMQNAILYRSVRMIAEAAASIPLLLYEGNEELEDHPLVDLMRQPSLDHTTVDFLESWYGFLLVAGNAYVEAVALNGELRELHVLRPDRMKVIPGPDGWPEGYEYTAGGQSIRFMDEAVPGVRPILHVKMFHPANDHYGMSPIEAASVAIDIHNEASKWNKALLDNSARPSGALVYAAANGQMTGEQFQRLKDELETSYQGARHAGRPLLLEGGLDWKPLSLSPKDMDFIEAKNSAAREIALAMGVPPQLLGIPGDNTYCWDARPFPAFPQQTEIWGDGANWQYGHWLNGRLASAPLAETVAKILDDYGFADHVSGSLNGTVPGYVIDHIMSARDALQPLELAYFFDSLESGGNITFRHRGQEAPAMTVSTDTMVEERPGSPLLSLTRGQETELPASAKIRFISGEDDYRQAVAEARRLAGASGRVAQADLPIVLEDGLAAGIAETWLFENWAARERASFTLPPSALALEPGDVVTLQQGAKTRSLRVTEISEHGAREITARGIDPDVYGRVGAPERLPRPFPVIQIGQPAAAFLDLPLLSGEEAPETGYMAAVQQPWPGGVAVYASPQTSGYALKGVIPAPATLGRTLDPLYAGPEGRIDWAAKVRVKLSFGTLTSADLVSVGSGVNLAAVRNADGDWEVIQFLNAVLVDVGTYELTGLLRGQGGTEGAMGAPVAAGALFVVLDSAVMQLPLGLNDINLPLNWRYGPSNRGIGDASYAVTQHAFKGLGRRPLSPARVKGTRAVGGDLTVTWERRTRIGGDSWDVAEVPLGEDVEAYEIEIMSGAVVARTIAATSQNAVYAAAQQVIDFGSAQSAVSVRVYQKSALYGRGAARVAVV